MIHDAKNFAHWIKINRRERGWTQTQLAEASDMSRSYITTLESGGIALPTKPTRDKLHEAFRTDDDELADLGLLAWTETGDEYSPLEVNENGVSRKLIAEQKKPALSRFGRSSPTADLINSEHA